MMRFLLSILSALICFQAFGQKDEINQARSDIKKRTNLSNAESAMRDLLKDTANMRNMKIYQTLAEAVRAQYEVANEKLYLKENTDTASFFTTARKMFLAYEGLDSIDMQQGKNGKAKLRYRKKNAEYLCKYRKNLYNGGIYFIRKKNYENAYGMMDAYIDCKCQPLFTGYFTNASDSLLSSAAFWTMFCGYKLNAPDSILKYSMLASGNRRYRRRALVYMAEAYLQKGDTLKYLATLHKGFDENRNSKFFFTRLMDYYNNANKLDSAMYIVNTALQSDNDNALFLFAKSNMSLNMGNYAECIEICDTLIARNDTFPDVYLNAGVSYVNLALALEENVKSKRKNRNKILDYYMRALPYMEKYMQLRPDDKDKWAPSLYNIYLKLNMGRKFEEISEVLQKMRN